MTTTPVKMSDPAEYAAYERHHAWVQFSAILLGLSGLLRVFDAIWAFRYQGPLPARLDGALLGTDLDTYGWVYLGVAAVAIAAAAFVWQGSQTARWVGVGVAVIGCLVAMTWMPFYPLWALTYIMLNVLVVYGLMRYAGEQAPA